MHEHASVLLSLDGLLAPPIHPLSALANAAALLWDALPDINWAGFYLLDGGVLWLGPFHGKHACVRIEPGRGVCGTALSRNETLVVPDVHTFPGHIACDAASRSEIVVPLRVHGKPVGVLDVDSPSPGRFTPADRELLEGVASRLQTHIVGAGIGYDLQPGIKEDP